MSVSCQSDEAKRLEALILLVMPDCLFRLLPVGSFTHLTALPLMNNSLANHRASKSVTSGSWTSFSFDLSCLRRCCSVVPHSSFFLPLPYYLLVQNSLPIVLFSTEGFCLKISCAVMFLKAYTILPVIILDTCRAEHVDRCLCPNPCPPNSIS